MMLVIAVCGVAMVICLLTIKLASLCSLGNNKKRGFNLLADCKAESSQTKVWILETRLGSDVYKILLLCPWDGFFFSPSSATAISLQKNKHFMHHRVIITSWEERNLVRGSMNYAKI